MAINFVIRRAGSHEDKRLEGLRRQGVPLLLKHGAVSHRFGYYHSGPFAGQIIVVLTYPDMETYEQAMKGMSDDADWKRVAGEIEKLAPMQESYLTVITEEH
jgi:NIPSNAP